MPVCGGIPAFRLAAGSPVHAGFEVATLDSGAFGDVESGLWVFALYTSRMPGFVIWDDVSVTQTRLQLA